MPHNIVQQSDLLRAATEALRNGKRIRQWRAKVNLNNARSALGGLLYFIGVRRGDWDAPVRTAETLFSLAKMDRAPYIQDSVSSVKRYCLRHADTSLRASARCR